MPSLQIPDLPFEPTARERRLEILKELRKRIETEPPHRLSRAPEDLIREDREPLTGRDLLV